MIHVNVGPSALALGLIVPATLSAGFEVCVVGRPGDDGPSEFGIRSTGTVGRLRFEQVRWYAGPDRVTQLPSDLLERIQSIEPALITCSLRGKIEERRAFVEELLRLRPAMAETIVMACENTPAPAYEQIDELCHGLPGTRMPKTVVNRMCIALEADSGGRRMVSAHSLGEWLVERPLCGSSKILEALQGCPEFAVVDDILARGERKLWMVNGAHRALALMARRGNDDSRLEPQVSGGDLGHQQAPASDDLRTAVFDPATNARLGHLHASMNQALQIRHPKLSGNLEYAVEHVVAYAEHNDSVARVLKDFTRLDLRPFLAAFEERIATPARICHENGIAVDPFVHVLDVFLELIANIDAYEDNIELRSEPISARRDLEVVGMFRDAVAPWAGDVDKLTSHFAQVLAEHRAALGAADDHFDVR
jgi:hypothetical protein